MQITEIYRSIQGESSYAGLPCVFIRLTGCNLRCSWCDSEYTFTGGQRMSLDEVIAAVQALVPAHENQPAPANSTGGPQVALASRPGSPTSPISARWGGCPAVVEAFTPAHGSSIAPTLVEITGGEPLLQEREVIPLMERLLAAGCKVLLETSGERPLERVPEQVVKIVDVKCPGSGESGTFRQENLRALTTRDEVKFVLAGRADYEFASAFIREHHLDTVTGSIIFSPAFAKTAKGDRDTSHCLLDPRELAEWILEDNLPVRLGLQIHKFIWDPATKGV
jgi:7-carboxy-7-deazaguanine synthase